MGRLDRTGLSRPGSGDLLFSLWAAQSVRLPPGLRSVLPGRRAGRTAPDHPVAAQPDGGRPLDRTGRFPVSDALCDLGDAGRWPVRVTGSAAAAPGDLGALHRDRLWDREVDFQSVTGSSREQVTGFRIM